MALVPSTGLTPSGAISMANINQTLNRSATAAISFNDSQVRFLANQETGSVNMNAMRSKYYFSGNITVGLGSDKGWESYGYVQDGIVASGSISGAFFSSSGLAPNYLATEIYSQLNTELISNTQPAEAAWQRNMRLKIGSKATITLTWTPAGGGNGSYIAAGNTTYITAANVGSTFLWQCASS